MVEYNTAKRNYLKTQITSNTNDSESLEREILSDRLSRTISTTNIPSAWRDYFKAYGYTDSYKVHLSSLWWRWLTEKGFTQGSLRGKFLAFYINGSVNL